jgi:hypothetical protein
MTEIRCRLIFDSWVDSLPELRGSGPAERHLIYEGSDILLDLLLKNTEDGGRLYIGGQVMHADGNPEQVSNVPVFLLNGDSREQTATNALGEFSFRCSTAKDSVDLSIVVGARRLLIQGLNSPEPGSWHVVPFAEREKAVGNRTR